MSAKQTKRQKDISMFTERPQIASMMCNLEEDCTEIVEEVREQVGKDQTASGDLEQDQEAEEEKEDEVDPDDPIYGVKQRIANLNLDEASKQLIIERLQEASLKVKQGLVDR